MKTGKNRHLIVVILFSILALAILAAAIWTLGGQHKSFEHKFPVKTVIADVNGLKVGDNVWFAGVKIGIIKSIDLTDDGQVLVTMSIETKARKHIHIDSRTKLGTDGLIGNKIIMISAGTTTAPLIANNGYLYTDKGGSGDMMTLLDAASKNLVQITTNLKEISQRVLSGKGTLTTLLNDSIMASNLKYTLADSRNTMSRLNNGSGKVMDNLSSFSTRLNRSGTLINNLLTDTTSYDNLTESITRLKATMDTLALFSENLKQASEALNSSQHVTGILLHDEAAAGQLRSMLRNLDSSSSKLKEDLEAVRHNFLFRGYFKKKRN
ncbi:MlaD family protein [Chitinophaga qingshengii]|uniref:MCE family protein n=1 Tax=Chitinophaga qingshengii TaxID=1569794 RepID=A0ABR7TQS5_9BACT|nr:MlaD family protein [Chitinophaga qingshengii]MBC9932839.1 MCE family protein [Chitinophaga qingshengii]